MIRSRRLAGAILSAAATAGVPVVALGQVSGTWVNPSSGTWTIPLNWNSTPLYPDGGGSAVFGPNTWSSSTITLDTPVSLSSVQLNGPSVYTLAGQALTLTGPANINVSATPYLPASYSTVAVMVGPSITALTDGTAGITKSGPGLLRLSGINTFTGPITVNGGTLVIQNDAAWGANASTTLILNGGAVEQKQSYTTYPLSLTVGSRGGTIVDWATLTDISGSGELIFRGPIFYGFGGPDGQMSIVGPTSYTGHATVGGNVWLTGEGALANASGITISNRLHLDNYKNGSIADRVGDATSLTFRGGHLTARATTENLGQAVFERGLNVVMPIDSITALHFAQMSRENHAVARLGTGTLGSQILIAGTPPPLAGSGLAGTPDVGILPWASNYPDAYAYRPLTIVPAGGESGWRLRPLDASEYIYTVPTSVTASNLLLNSAGSVNVPATVNSLTMGARTLSGSATLSITSGAIFSDHSRIEVPIDFGIAEGIIHAPSEFQGPELTGPISGSGGLTITGFLTSLRGASTYTGPTTVLNAIQISDHVLVGQPGPLGLDSSPVQFEGGATDIGIIFTPAAGTLIFARDLTIRQYGAATTHLMYGSLTGAPPGDTEVSGDIEFEGPLLVRTYYGHPQSRLTVSGALSGTGHLHIGATTTLSGDNTFSGGVELQVAQLNLASDTALGSGMFWLAGGTVSAVGSRVISNPVYVVKDSNIAGSSPLTFSGPIDLSGTTRRLQILNSATTRFTGPVFNGNLTKTGNGLLEMANVRLPALTVQEGPLRIIPDASGNNTSRVWGLSIAAAASLDLTNNDLVIDYTGSSPLNTIRSYLADARLFSSMAIPNVTTLAYAENALLGYTTFSGQSVDSTSLLIKYTFFGDANLDGTVNLRDLMMFASGWQTDGPWTSGDFNLDGIVDHTDLGLLARNWQAGDVHLGTALADLNLPSVPIPEPALGVICGSLCLLWRRRAREDRKSL